jgi:transaldolase
MSDIAGLSHAIAVEGWRGPGHADAPSDARLAALIGAGTELWLDTGDLDDARRLWRREFSGLTTNNTLVNQVAQTGALDDVIRTAADRLRASAARPTTQELVLEIGFIVNCRLALRLVETFGVRVSVELHPAMAHDIDHSVRFGRRYHAVGSSHFWIKVPLTAAGYCIAARLESEGVKVNFTLGFSARQNYLAALVSRPHFVNVFLGRLNAVVADNRLGDGRNVGEKATLATARAIRDLRARHPEVPTRLIAASMRAPSQVSELAGVDVHTIPPKVAQDFLAGAAAAADIRSQVERDPEVQSSDASGADGLLRPLWEVDDRTRAVAADLLRANPLTLTDEDFIRAAQDHGVGLFHGFTAEEEAEIAAHGKIPDLARWSAEVPLDELMNQAGLQSFAADQRQLDNRIRGLMG